MSNLLATDKLARQYGCKLKPELRAAIEADLRFPAHAASPIPQEERTLGELPENVVRIGVSAKNKQRFTA
ncbi:hypothetical protein [Ruegeria sp. Ofav3-42]|uniref:hypothetical protein n=1 Tax=Ruegeria sp. Ofav3-42 TaxID=2917759 RepID=UPI001EF49863|nr:hypothetical protein [Ruegeria sp. Ofav3-42]MCG7521551.1 hypothetical protein [Ruegeria sp. Ofav3-42]